MLVDYNLARSFDSKILKAAKLIKFVVFNHRDTGVKHRATQSDNVAFAHQCNQEKKSGSIIIQKTSKMLQRAGNFYKCTQNVNIAGKHYNC